MSRPRTARPGIVLAGVGTLLAVLVTFLLEETYLSFADFILMIRAIIIGIIVSWISGKKVAITAIPQMIALYNGIGGAAAAIAASEALHFKTHYLNLVLALIWRLIGMIAFNGSLIAFGKLQGVIRKRSRYLRIMRV